MARTAGKVRSLVEEDPSLGEAIASIIEAADEGDGEVEWSDVREDLTTGQWGRLIEKGILDEGVRGFELADPEETKEVLDELDVDYLVATSDSTDTEGSSWTQWDKLAAIFAVTLFAGYAWQPAREVAGSTMDLLIGPLADTMPLYGVIMLLALFTGLYSTILQANLVDREKMSQYRQQMQAINRRRKKAQEEGDEEELDRIQQEQLEAMGDQLGMFKEQFRPMVWIMFLTIPVFLWLLWAVSSRLGSPAQPGLAGREVILPLSSGAMTWDTGLIWYLEPWLVWYFVCSLAFTQLIRKSLNIQMTPTG